MTRAVAAFCLINITLAVACIGYGIGSYLWAAINSDLIVVRSIAFVTAGVIVGLPSAYVLREMANRRKK